MSAYLLAGVLVRQGSAGGDGDGRSWLPVWRMFAGASKGVTQVRYVRTDPTGGRAEVDRFEVLGLDELDQPPGVWLVRGTGEAQALGERLCGALGTDVTIEMSARTAVANGWREEPVVPNVCGQASERSVP